MPRPAPDYTPDEFIRMWMSDMTTASIAAAIGGSKTWVRLTAAALGLPPKTRRQQKHYNSKPKPDPVVTTPPDYTAIRADLAAHAGTSMPAKTIGVLVARHRLPVAVVQALAAEVWR